VRLSEECHPIVSKSDYRLHLARALVQAVVGVLGLTGGPASAAGLGEGLIIPGASLAVD